MATKAKILKMVRMFCSECNGGPRASEGVWPVSNIKDIDECPATDCVWHTYRFGSDPEKSAARQEMGRKLAAALHSRHAQNVEDSTI
jgi:hypothetical protein